MLLENKNAVVYGAGGAIGGAVAKAFAREGARGLLTAATWRPRSAPAASASSASGQPGYPKRCRQRSSPTSRPPRCSWPPTARPPSPVRSSTSPAEYSPVSLVSTARCSCASRIEGGPGEHDRRGRVPHRYRLMIHPVVLGGGEPLFAGSKTPKQLRIAGTTTASKGVVVLDYERAG